MALTDVIAGIFKPVSDVLDHVLPSGDEKIKLKEQLFAAQVTATSEAMDYEKQLLESQTSVVLAEAKGGSWIQRNWRPISMLTFVALIVARWLGYSATNLSPAEALELWGIVKLGMGGYVIGRSVEKVAPSITSAILSSRKS